MGKPEPLGEILARKNVGAPRRKKQALELIRLNWATLVGERLSAQTAPTKMARGTLGVSANGGAWAAELCLKESELMSGAERMLGAGVVKKIRVKATGWPANDPDEGPGEARRTAAASGSRGPVIDGEIGEGIRSLGDPEMSEALSRLVLASRAGRQSRQKRK